MYCRFCGKKIESDSIFCRYCGQKVEVVEEIVEKTTQQVVENEQPEQQPVIVDDIENAVVENAESVEKPKKSQKSLLWLVILLAVILALVILIDAISCGPSTNMPSATLQLLNF